MGQVSQNDIVRDSLLKECHGPELEKINIPGLASIFDKKPLNTKEEKRIVRVSGISRQGKSREVICDMLVNILDYEPGITGFKWSIKSDNVEVTYVKNFRQKDYSNDKSEILEVLNMLLKLRKNMISLEWYFGDSFVTIES